MARVHSAKINIIVGSINSAIVASGSVEMRSSVLTACRDLFTKSDMCFCSLASRRCKQIDAKTIAG